MADPVVIVGASHAAVQAIDTLHRTGYAGGITLIGDEPRLPYNRPPLSKKFLAGELVEERLQLRSPQFYQQAQVQALLGRRVTAFDRGSRRLRLDDGSELGYSQLLLCIGSRPRRLELPGAGLPGIHYLRTLADVCAIRAGIVGARRAVVVGAGYIGLETAATLRQLGLEVTVVEMGERPMNRVVAPTVSEYFERRHAREGVRILCDTGVLGFSGEQHVSGVETTRGGFAADIVVVGVGVVAEVTLAAAAGIKCDNGIVVDEACRSSDPLVYAAGDCTNHPSLRYGRRVRLESVDNAAEQGRVAALNICGREARHEHLPWFWSDQYDVKLQIAGLSQGHDSTLLRGDPAADSFALYYLRQGELLAVDAVNSQRDFISAKRWLAERRTPDLERLADPGTELKSL